MELKYIKYLLLMFILILVKSCSGESCAAELLCRECVKNGDDVCVYVYDNRRGYGICMPTEKYTESPGTIIANTRGACLPQYDKRGSNTVVPTQNPSGSKRRNEFIQPGRAQKGHTGTNTEDSSRKSAPNMQMPRKNIIEERENYGTQDYESLNRNLTSLLINCWAEVESNNQCRAELCVLQEQGTKTRQQINQYSRDLSSCRKANQDTGYMEHKINQTSQFLRDAETKLLKSDALFNKCEIESKALSDTLNDLTASEQGCRLNLEDAKKSKIRAENSNSFYTSAFANISATLQKYESQMVEKDRLICDMNSTINENSRLLQLCTSTEQNDQVRSKHNISEEPSRVCPDEDAGGIVSTNVLYVFAVIGALTVVTVLAAGIGMIAWLLWNRTRLANPTTTFGTETIELRQRGAEVPVDDLIETTSISIA